MRNFLFFVSIFLFLSGGSAFAAVSNEQTVGNEKWIYSISNIALSESFQLPEIANRKGSKRVGGTNSKGKGSRYSGGGR